MSVVFNAATAANVNILRTTNELFQVAQKRVATGKRIFGAADDATRYNMSQTMLSRSRNIDSVNNNISTALKTLESTDIALKQIRNLLQQMNDRASKAAATGGVATVGTQGNQNIGETTFVNGYSNGMRLSITSDNGANFTFNFGNSSAGTASSGNVTWGQISNALNAANIGVRMRFDTSNAAAPRLIIESTDNSTGFSIDGSTSAQVIDDLASLTVPGYDGGGVTGTNSSKFANGSAMPTGFAGTTPYGLRFGTGGAVTGVSAMPSASANSSISFVGADGIARTWSTVTVKSQDAVVAEINAMNAGVRAEIVTGGRLRLRKLDGTAMVVLNGSGTFDPSGNGRLNTTAGQPYISGAPILGSMNNSDLLELGKQYESIKTEITAVINNNVVQAGRNLLTGQSMNVILNEFSANPIAIAGQNVTVTGYLALTTTGASWATASNVQLALAEVQNAQKNVDTLAGTFGTYASYIKERYDINREFASNMKTLGDDLVGADVAEESAKLTALQTQQQFAVQAFSAGSTNAQNLLRLLG